VFTKLVRWDSADENWLYNKRNLQLTKISTKRTQKKRETMADSTISKPDKKITYAIPHEEDGGCLFLYGKPDAKHIVLTCAGFPDDHGSFGPLAQRLAKESNCLVGVTCLPGFDDRPDKPWKNHHKEGFTFLEVVASLHEATKVLRAYSTNPEAKFTAIFHDWGCLVGLMFTNRALTLEEDDSSEHHHHAFTPDQVVLFDVCLGAHPKATNVPVPPPKTLLYFLYDLAVQVSYRLLLALCFLLQYYVSSKMAANLFDYGFLVLNILRLSPVRAIDNNLSATAPTDPQDYKHRITYMAYPYYYLWKVIFRGKLDEDGGIVDLAGVHLPKDLTTTPVLYMYGLDKNIQFHQDDGLCLLEHEHEQGRRSNAIAVKDAGHWLYKQQADICFAQVDAFIQELK
jgi:pimeloyl-ACP methyl ester carboxylesterase